VTTERILGGIAIAFGGLLLFEIIPDNARSIEGLIVDPSTFPNMAAFLIAGLGIIQIVASKQRMPLPTAREFWRVLMIAALTAVAVLALGEVGYLATMFVFMALIIVIVHERRPVWMATVIVGMPVVVWAFFEVLLKRPLP